MKKSIIRKFFALFITLTFSFNLIIPPSYAQAVSTTLVNLPNPGSMIATTPAFAPAAMRGLMIYPDNPLKFDFVIDRGDTKLTEDEFKAESTKLVRYFLASLTVPEKDMWVNLSPYEKNRIIPDNFGQTEMGRDLLAQDYILKQLTASLMYPENETGKEFWNKIYAKINERFGMTDIPLNTFNKVWIIPDKVSIYEHTKGAFIVKGRLKVMLEEDYVAMENNSQQSTVNSPQQNDESAVDGRRSTVDQENNSLTATIQSQMVREIIIPEIEREVNEGSTFTQLRQIYYSMILASWYKKALKESLLGKVYVDQNKTEGVDIADKNENQKIYEKYIEAFKQGAYDYVKEDYNAETQEVVTRKYVSGGVTLRADEAMTTEDDKQTIDSTVNDLAQKADITTFELNGETDAAMLSRRGFLQKSASVLAGLLLTPLIGEAGQNGEEAARLYQRANSLRNTSPKQAEELYRRALSLSETTSGKMKITNNLGDSLEGQNKIKEATATYEQALGLARSLIQSKDINEDNKFAIAAVYLNVGDMYTLQGNLQKARSIYTEAKFLDPVVFDIHSKYPGIKRIYDILEPALFNISRQVIQDNPIATQFNPEFRDDILSSESLDFKTIKGKPILMFGRNAYSGREMYDDKQIRWTGIDTVQIMTPGGTYEIKKDIGIVNYNKSDDAMTASVNQSFIATALALLLAFNNAEAYTLTGTQEEIDAKQTEVIENTQSLIDRAKAVTSSSEDIKVRIDEMERLVKEAEEKTRALLAQKRNIEVVTASLELTESLKQSHKTLKLFELYENSTNVNTEYTNSILEADLNKRLGDTGKAKEILEKAINDILKKIEEVKKEEEGLKRIKISVTLTKNKNGKTSTENIKDNAFNLINEDFSATLANAQKALKGLADPAMTAELEQSMGSLAKNLVAKYGAEEIATKPFTREFIKALLKEGQSEAKKTAIENEIKELAGTFKLAGGIEITINETGQWFITPPVGGIDFNPENLKMNLKKDGSGVQFAPISDEAIQGMNINGFVPVIINVIPATNLPFILGIKKEDDKENLAYRS